MKSVIVFGVATLVFGVAAVAYRPVVEPEIVLLPGDVASTLMVSGTFEVDATPGSLARLPAPVTQPFDASTVLKAVAVEDDRIVLSSTETQKVGDPAGTTQDVTLASQFVLDRHTTANVQDPRAWSITPDHVVDRSGSYLLSFGFDFRPNRAYDLWDDSIDAGYPMSRGGDAGSVPPGTLTVTAMAGSVTQHPADPAWIAALTPLNLPDSLTSEQWQAAGFAGLGSSATAQARYFVTIETSLTVDDESGGIADLLTQSVEILVAPDPAATGGTARPPLAVARSHYSETPASAATADAILASTATELNLAERTIPRLLTALAIASAVLLGVALLRRRRARAER